MTPIKCSVCKIMFRPRIKANVRCKACSPLAKKGDGKPAHLREPTAKSVALPDRREVVWANPRDYDVFGV